MTRLGDARWQDAPGRDESTSGLRGHQGDPQWAEDGPEEGEQTRPPGAIKAVYCGRCAGTGEFPPTGGVECSFCGGEGEIYVNDLGVIVGAGYANDEDEF